MATKEKKRKKIPNCPVCGQFMRQLKTVERIAIETNGGGKRKYICDLESFTYKGSKWLHESF